MKRSLRRWIRWLRLKYVLPRITALKRFKRSFSLGSRGEQAAARFLIRDNYFIWDRNVSTKFGEIDIIAAKKRILVFVEVKTRADRSAQVVSGREAVDEQKQRRLNMLAQRYLLDKRAMVKFRRIRSYRFDVIEVRKRGRFGRLRVKQYKAAF